MIEKNNPCFSTPVEEQIWNLATNLVPLEVTLPMVPQQLHPACTAFYQFMTDLCNDMYEHTAVYGLEEPQHVWDYARSILEWMFKKFQYENDAFTAASATYKKYLKKLGPRQVKLFFTRGGFCVEEHADVIRVTNPRYPGMLTAVYEVLTAAQKHYSVNRCDYLVFCEFRALVNYKRTYHDMYHMLNDQAKVLAQQLHDYASQLGVKPVKLTYFRRTEFKKKGKMVFVLDVASQNNLKVNIGFAEIGGQAFALLKNEIEQYEDKEAFTAFWRKNLKRCTNCTPNCYKRGVWQKNSGLPGISQNVPTPSRRS